MTRLLLVARSCSDHFTGSILTIIITIGKGRLEGVMSIKRSRVPEPLICQCQYYILMHLEEFPVSYLSLLPLSTRKELLWQLPVADVCLLEDTKFTEGLDMAAYCKYPLDDQAFGVSSWFGEDLERYAQEWDNTEYEREMLYGLLTTYAFGSDYLRNGDFYFRSPHVEDEQFKDASLFLYAIRKSGVHDGCVLKLPSRYSQITDKHEKKLSVDEVMSCFGKGKGELPKIFAEIGIFHNANLDYVHFLREVVYFGTLGFPLEEQGLEFLKAVIKEAPNLEVLILDHWGEDDVWLSLDDLCICLYSHPTFLSKFRQLTIHSTISFLGFFVSRKNFNQLITAYFAAPTDHTQKLEFSHTKIECCDISDECSPKICQHYLPYKTIELDCECQFVSEYEATPTTISQWLGQGICKLKCSPMRSSCLFMVEEKTCNNTRKRKRYSEHSSELDYEDCNHAD